ncbi:MAG: imidazole glycerol phosphate synthase subunit HisF [bacterium]|nr:imidazole glycerol phosphate synthase subunit HisF [bacterium]
MSNLTKRIIPCMDIADGRVVKGINFKQLQDAGDPVELAKLYSNKGADELVFLDITATIENRLTLYELVEKVAAQINIPFTVGGGIRILEDIGRLLKFGADKVSIGSTAVTNSDFVKQAAERFGTQCIVISIDSKQVGDSWEIYIKGGREATGIDAIKFARKMERLGAGELLVNSLDRDGTKQGYDLALMQTISTAVNIPIIASSGVGKSGDFLDVFSRTDVDAALAASVFHSRGIDIQRLKKYLLANNIKVRI